MSKHGPKKHKKKAHHNTQNSHHNEESETHIDPVIEAAADEAQMEAEANFEETTSESEADHGSAQDSHHAEEEKTRLEFPYSELVRAYAPKAMDMADKVANDWKNNGSFMNLGIDNPYANMAVSLGLQNAKKIEKKLDEKGVLSAVRMGVEVLKQEVNKRKK